jgi:hypothetical protein
MIYGKSGSPKKRKHRFHDIGFKQGHSGREDFSSGEWGRSSELIRPNVYRESDSYDQLNATGVDFDIDKRRDDDLFSREYNRSRFVDSSFSEGYVGKGPKGYRRSDERIYEDACEALFRNPTMDASEIVVKVDGGLITLNGTVIDRDAKKEAEHCLDHIIGVVDIQNDLNISSQSSQVLS